MTKYILVAGIGFYIITFLAIFYLTWANFDESRPENAKVINVNTFDKVWQPNRGGFDKFVEARDNAMVNLAHANELYAENGELSEGGQAVKAYGDYHNGLYTDGNGETSPASITGGEAHYTEAVCWHCHSQFVRPLRSENHRWGPTTQIGESAHDNPTRYGTRRIGPDLQREGNRRPDDWHYAHFDNPKNTVPQSIMAPYGGISRYWFQVPQSELDERQAEVDSQALDFFNTHIETADSKPNPRALAAFEWVAGLNAERNDVWHLYKGHVDGFSNNSMPVVRVAKKPKKRIRDLVAYVQTRGVGIGITGKTDTKFGQNADLMITDDPATHKYLRKLNFSAGIWRRQMPAPRPMSRPAHVLAPAEIEAMNPATGEDFVFEREKQSHREYVAIREAWDKSNKAGMTLFMAKCAGCHGGLDDDGDPLEVRMGDPDSLLAVGNGYGPAAEWLSPEPRNLHLASFSSVSRNADAVTTGIAKDKNGNIRTPRERGSEVIAYKNRSGHPDINLATPQDLFHTIRNGMPPSAMPAWPYLTDREVWDLVNFVMYLGDGRQAAVQEVESYEAETGTELENRDDVIDSLIRNPFDNPFGGAAEEWPDAWPEARYAKQWTYYNLPIVRQTFDQGETVPTLPLRSTNERKVTDPKEREAALFWARKLGLIGAEDTALDDQSWTKSELVSIGKSIFEGNGFSGGASPDCKSCHGIEGDGWGSDRARMLQNTGFAARNYYRGTFKLGATRSDIWRAMRYGIAGTPMNAQTAGMSALESLALAEFVLDKANQGVMGIRD